jgi:hypothetical protein
MTTIKMMIMSKYLKEKCWIQPYRYNLQFKIQKFVHMPISKLCYIMDSCRFLDQGFDWMFFGSLHGFMQYKIQCKCQNYQIVAIFYVFMDI